MFWGIHVLCRGPNNTFSEYFYKEIVNKLDMGKKERGVRFLIWDSFQRIILIININYNNNVLTIIFMAFKTLKVIQPSPITAFNL